MGTCPHPKLPHMFSVENLGEINEEKKIIHNHAIQRSSPLVFWCIYFFPDSYTVLALKKKSYCRYSWHAAFPPEHSSVMNFSRSLRCDWLFLTGVDGNYHLQFSDRLSDWSWRHAAVQRILGNVMDLWHSLRGETSGRSRCTLQVSHNCASRCAGESQWHL